MLPQCSHITRKRGVYYFRKRLPLSRGREVAISLRTRCFRLAQYLAEKLTDRYDECFAQPMTDYAKIAHVLRDELQRLLRDGRDRIIRAPYGKPVMASNFDGPAAQANRADIEACDWAIKQFKSDLARRDLRGPEASIRQLMREHGIPEDDFQPFGLAWF
jgi:hypothetical protein